MLFFQPVAQTFAVLSLYRDFNDLLGTLGPK